MKKYAAETGKTRPRTHQALDAEPHPGKTIGSNSCHADAKRQKAILPRRANGYCAKSGNICPGSVQTE